MSHPAVFRPLQTRFLAIPQTPLCYWLRERFFELLAGPTLGDVADVCQGLATANDARFVRFVWEARLSEWARPVRARRWVPFEKGGGYGKWFGHQFWVVDWQYQGRRIKASPTAVVRNEEHYFEEGWTYSWIARGSLGLRTIDHTAIIAGAASSGVFGTDIRASTGCILNCRFASAIVRSTSAKIQLPESYVSRIPVPRSIRTALTLLQPVCIALKRCLVERDPCERSYHIRLADRTNPLPAGVRPNLEYDEAVAAVLHALEGASERQVFSAYGIAGDDLAAVLEETGTPTGWRPLLRGYDALPAQPDGLTVPEEILALISYEPRVEPIGAELTSLKKRLRSLYEAGPGGNAEENAGEEATTDDDAEEVIGPGASIPIPTETFLEELSQMVELHPISVYWLIEELRQEGVHCKPEEQRLLEDRLSVLVLRLLGHRWPKQAEVAEAVPDWAELSGIIPLTAGTAQATLVQVLRARLRSEDGDLGAQRTEALLVELTGLSLEEWLGRQFFSRHVRQFKYRPIAWHLASRPTARRGGKRGRGTRVQPAFECLLYYHACSGDILARLRTQHVEPLLQRTRAKAEEDRQRQQESGAGEQVRELEAFAAALRNVEETGFACPESDKVLATEPLDRWSGDGQWSPDSRDELLHQECGWHVDINDGVRVNIAPLQLAGLLASDVLKTADATKAIADRARWRADERRWVREGKLPRCGWMPEDIRESARWTALAPERAVEQRKLEAKRAAALARIEGVEMGGQER